jgi:thiosulfate/3-mercaptopyruvate sulfurtransferase
MRMIEPIVSTEWLAENSDLENLVVIDIRSPDAYAARHIPGSISEPFVTAFDPCTGPTSKWIVGGADCLWFELPPANDLFATIGNLGITPDSQVVIVTAPNPEEPPLFGLANATRVADTLIYAGIEAVAILDGGYPKWVAQGRRTTQAASAPVAVPYQGQVTQSMTVAREYVQKLSQDTVLIDARDANVYAGVVVEPFAEKAGHIPKAKSLPAPWIWNRNTDGTFTYKDIQTLRTMAAGAVGESREREIVLYCGVGGYASAWWYVFSRVLGYQNVKIYGGSAQEWAKYDDMTID